MTDDRLFCIGIALEGVGWHPASWSHSTVADPAELFTADYWVDWARAAASGGIDFVTLEDGLSLQADQFGTAADDAGRRVRGRLDSVVVAALLLSMSDISEVVVTRNVTHSNPFHVAAQLASLAAIGPGRVVWRPQVSADARDAVVVGGTSTPALEPEDVYVPPRIARRLRDLFRDAEDYVHAVRRLWATFPGEGLGGGGKFWQPEQVRPATLEGRPRYPAAGPLTVPVGTPPSVAVLAHHALEPYRLGAAVADRLFLTPTSDHPIPELLAAFHQIEELTPDATPTLMYADIAVVLGDSDDHAHDRLARLNDAAGAPWSTDTSIFVGTADRLADELTNWRDGHGLSGVRLRPSVLPDDAERIIHDLVPLLRPPASGAANSDAGRL
ncbi:LLM class flavin-dependent oxidoreductase [Streptomyces sp. NPDC005301]|uniref:LLM class flavin-dependent oxidoreductase n=1 Tax=Streptomyces sp. NPDC005301 TaxID=3156874 RepID=UPI0033AFA1F4